MKMCIIRHIIVAWWAEFKKELVTIGPPLVVLVFLTAIIYGVYCLAELYKPTSYYILVSLLCVGYLIGITATFIQWLREKYQKAKNDCWDAEYRDAK